jgi:RNA polymerase sigma factor (sigma-70 family)
MHLADIDRAPTRTDPRAERFRALYRGEFGFVWAAARRLGVPPAALDDAVQEVFITAYRRLDQLYYEVSPRAWLYGVTRRVASRHRRGAVRLARRLAAFGEVQASEGVEPHAERDAARTLAALLDHLPRETREVWELTELLGMSGPEIAGELGVPLNTVYSRLRLARARLHALAADAEALASAARREEQPPPGAARRSWALIVPVLGREGALAGIVGAWTASRAAMATTLIAATVAATRVVPVEREAPVQRAAPVVAAAEELPVRTDLPPAPVAAAPSVQVEPRRAAARQVAIVDPLAAEVALIDRARAHLTGDEPGAALAVLATHAREFPRGVLVDAREAARVEALCREGRAAEAEAAARLLWAQLPGSPLARRFEGYVCEEK